MWILCKNLIIYLLYIVFLSFSHKFSRSLRWLDCVLSPTYIRNESMQCALPTPFIAYLRFLGSLFLTWQLPKFTESTHKSAQNCVCPKIVCRRGGGGWQEKGRGITWEWGDSAMVVGGIDAPACMPGDYLRQRLRDCKVNGWRHWCAASEVRKTRMHRVRGPTTTANCQECNMVHAVETRDTSLYALDVNDAFRSV